jgi:hypothetical protein
MFPAKHRLEPGRRAFFHHMFFALYGVCKCYSLCSIILELVRLLRNLWKYVLPVTSVTSGDRKSVMHQTCWLITAVITEEVTGVEYVTNFHNWETEVTI